MASLAILTMELQSQEVRPLTLSARLEAEIAQDKAFIDKFMPRLNAKVLHLVQWNSRPSAEALIKIDERIGAIADWIISNSHLAPKPVSSHGPYAIAEFVYHVIIQAFHKAQKSGLEMTYGAFQINNDIRRTLKNKLETVESVASSVHSRVIRLSASR